MEKVQYITFFESVVMACMVCEFSVMGTNPPTNEVIATNLARTKGMDHVKATGHRMDYVYKVEGKIIADA